MAKLNQILAVEKGLKTTANRAITDLYHLVQRTPLISGISRTYRPLDEESNEVLPAEHQRVQVNAFRAFQEATKALSRLMDITAVKDWANTEAKADVVVDGALLLPDVPVTYLLFMEKQLTDLQTFISKLPSLDPAEEWHYDANTDSYRTNPVETQRSKKVPKAFVLHPPTDKHPAQVQAYQEDILVGFWTKVTYSGAVPAGVIRTLTERVSKLQDAVKFAREEANGHEVRDVEVGKRVFDYLFRDLVS